MVTHKYQMIIYFQSNIYNNFLWTNNKHGFLRDVMVLSQLKLSQPQHSQTQPKLSPISAKLNQSQPNSFKPSPNLAGERPLTELV